MQEYTNKAIEPQSELRNQFLEGMSHAACTVNIVTTDGAAGRAGVTISAMSSVSADTPKPTLLVCVQQDSLAAKKIIANGVFCVNVLRDDQAYVSDTFAGRFNDVVTDKFECAQWSAMSSGAPRVVDPLVGFDCRLISSNLVGMHHVIFGEVIEIFVAQRGSPLIYANRAYGTTSRIERNAFILSDRMHEGKTLSVGCFHTFGPYFMPEIITRICALDPSHQIKLVEGDQRKVLASLQAGEIEVALVYDLDLPSELVVTPLTELIPYVLLAEGHPLAEQSHLTPVDLADYPMVLLDGTPSADYFTGILEKSGVTPRIGHRSASFEMVRGLVGHGLGYTLLATKPASPMTYDGQALVSRRLVAEFQPSRVVLVRRMNTEESELALEFQSICKEFFAENYVVN